MVVGDIKFVVCKYICLSVCLFGTHFLRNCSTDGGLSRTLRVVFWWLSPQGSLQGRRKCTMGKILYQFCADGVVVVINCVCLCQFLGRWYSVAAYSDSTFVVKSGVAHFSRTDRDDVINLLITGAAYTILTFPTYLLPQSRGALIIIRLPIFIARHHSNADARH